MYKKASKLKLRFTTLSGVLNTEDLWNLSKPKLVSLIKSLKEKIKEDDVEDLAFLDNSSKQVNEVDQLRFEIAKDVYLTRKQEEEDAKNASETKKQNEAIMALIKEKEHEDLKGKSVEELRKLLK